MIVYTRPLYGAMPTRTQGAWPRVVTAVVVDASPTTWTLVYDTGTHVVAHGLRARLEYDPALTPEVLQAYYLQSKETK